MSVGNAIIGSVEQLYISPETSFGVFKAPIGDDAVRIISDGFTVSQERVNRKDKRNSRSISARISRKKTAEFTLSMYMLPSGTAGAPPDVHYALKAVFGDYANSAGADTYTLDRDINESYTISRILGEDLGESFTGSVFNEIKIKFAGEDEVMIELGGFSKEWIRTTPTAITSDTTTSADFVVDDTNSIEVGSIVKIGSDDNSGAGFEIINYVVATKTATIGATESFTLGDAVVPFFADATTTGDPLGCFPGSISLDGTSFCFSDFEITLTNNIQMRNNCFGSESATGYSATSFREVTFTGTLYMDSNNLNLPSISEGFSSQAIVVTAGSVAGRISTVTMPTAELNLVSYEIPEEEEVTYSIEGQALAPNTAESEINMVFT